MADSKAPDATDPGDDPYIMEYLEKLGKTTIVMFISRSKNKNIVVYEANVGEDGKLNAADPITAYWLDIDPEYIKKNRAKGKTTDRDDLNVFERKAAYGAYAEAIADRPGEYEVTFVAFPSRKFVLKMVEGRPRLSGQVSGREATMEKLYVYAVERTLLPPKVVYVNLYAKDNATNERVVERVEQ